MQIYLLIFPTRVFTLLATRHFRCLECTFGERFFFLLDLLILSPRLPFGTRRYEKNSLGAPIVHATKRETTRTLSALPRATHDVACQTTTMCG